jgi:hypothetical protein
MTMLHDVVDARCDGDHRLYVRFDDGVEGTVDLSTRLRFDGVFEPLKDPAEFAKVSVDPELGTVVWPTGADLDPVVLYSLVTGQPVAGSVAEDHPHYPTA